VGRVCQEKAGEACGRVANEDGALPTIAFCFSAKVFDTISVVPFITIHHNLNKSLIIMSHNLMFARQVLGRRAKLRSLRVWRALAAAARRVRRALNPKP